MEEPPPAALTGIKVGTQARPHPRRLGNVELTLWAVVLLQVNTCSGDFEAGG